MMHCPGHESRLPPFAPGAVPFPGLQPGGVADAGAGAVDSRSPFVAGLAVSLGLPGRGLEIRHLQRLGADELAVSGIDGQ